MTLPEAVILGLVQGLTEFLPVSSSGHLVIVSKLLGISEPHLPFDVLVHLATLVAVLIYFRSRLLKITKQQIIILAVGTLPAVLAGFLIAPIIDQLFTSTAFVGFGLIITSAVLWTTRGQKGQGKLQTTKPRTAMLIGMAQAFAIVPGISRSGSTIAAGLNLGLQKDDAFFFSFLLAIPAILGAGLFIFLDLQTTTDIFSTPNLLGFFTALASGLVSLKLLRMLLEKAHLHWFSYYCAAVGTLVLVSSLF